MTRPKPSEVGVALPCPFGALLGKAELEQAAAVVVGACRLRDAWEPVSSQDFVAYAESVGGADSEWGMFVRNPFVNPDFDGLEKHGYVEIRDDVIEPLEKLLDIIAPRREPGAQREPEQR